MTARVTLEKKDVATVEPKPGSQPPIEPPPTPLPPVDSKPPAVVQTDGFVPLFNGKDLTGWKADGGGKLTEWGVTDGVLHCDGEKSGGLLTEKEYANYELRLEFKLSAKGNSGVVLRGKPSGGPAAEVAMEIQLLDDEWFLANRKGVKKDQLTGALYGVVPPTRAASKPTGEWNAMRIVATERTVRVELNGEKVVDAALDSHSSSSRSFRGFSARRVTSGCCGSRPAPSSATSRSRSCRP